MLRRDLTIHSVGKCTEFRSNKRKTSKSIIKAVAETNQQVFEPRELKELISLTHFKSTCQTLTIINKTN